jgi:hypothetical protein
LKTVSNWTKLFWMFTFKINRSLALLIPSQEVCSVSENYKRKVYVNKQTRKWNNMSTLFVSCLQTCSYLESEGGVHSCVNEIKLPLLRFKRPYLELLVVLRRPFSSFFDCFRFWLLLLLKNKKFFNNFLH